MFSLDGTKVVTLASKGSELHLIDIPTGKLLQKFPCTDIYDRATVLLPGDRELLRINAKTSQAEFWDVATAKKRRGIALGLSWITDGFCRAAVSPDGKRLLTAHSDGYVRVWDLGAGRVVDRLQVDEDARGLTFSRDGRFAAAGSDRGDLYVWRLLDATKR